jgi:hypothetical protein
MILYHFCFLKLKRRLRVIPACPETQYFHGAIAIPDSFASRKAGMTPLGCLLQIYKMLQESFLNYNSFSMTQNVSLRKAESLEAIRFYIFQFQFNFFLPFFQKYLTKAKYLIIIKLNKSQEEQK